MLKKLLKIFDIKKIMKKILGIVILSLLFFSNVNAEERKSELDKLFTQLKNTKNLN